MIFCKLLARTHSIEFQKRGYPHVHIIVWVDMDCVRHLDPEIIDKIVCAKIPNEYKKTTKQRQRPTTYKESISQGCNILHVALTTQSWNGMHEERMLPVRLSKRVLS